MKTIEDYMRVAFDLGKIAGAAEAIEEQYPRDSIYGTAHSLFDGTLEEALEEENQRKAEIRELQKRAVAEAAGLPMLDYRPAPDDVIVQRADGTPAQKQTNFSVLTKSPETLAEYLGEQPYCGRGEVRGDCDEKCIPCVLEWLNMEATV